MMKTRTRMVMGEGTMGFNVYCDGNAVHMEIAELNEQTTMGFKKDLDFKEGNALTMEWGDPKKFIEWVRNLQVVAENIEHKLILKDLDKIPSCGGCLADSTPFCPGEERCENKSYNHMDEYGNIFVGVPQMGLDVEKTTKELREFLDMLDRNKIKKVKPADSESIADAIMRHIEPDACHNCDCSAEPSKAMALTMAEGNIICNFEGCMPRSVHKNGYCGAYKARGTK